MSSPAPVLTQLGPLPASEAADFALRMVRLAIRKYRSSDLEASETFQVAAPNDWVEVSGCFESRNERLKEYKRAQAQGCIDIDLEQFHRLPVYFRSWCCLASAIACPIVKTRPEPLSICIFRQNNHADLSCVIPIFMA